MLRLFSIPSFVFVTLSGCTALVAFLLTDYTVLAAVAKLIASTAFVALAIQAGATGFRYGQLILLGLVFSWFGDMLLIGSTRPLFLAGLGAFLLAHIAYIAAFVTLGVSARWIALATLPVAAAGIAASVWLTTYLPQALAIPVRAYTIVISLMVILAIGTRGRGATSLIVAGAVMFFLSDLSVAALRLVETAVPTYVLGLPLYYAGQLCLAVSVARSRVDAHRIS